MSRDLYLFKDVEDCSQDIISTINRINEEDKNKSVRVPIKIYINSVGGNTYDCFAITEAIINSKTPIHTIVTGCAMSSALLVAVVGHERFCYKTSFYMYHQIGGNINGLLKDIENHSVLWYKFMEMYDDILLSKTKINKNKIDSVKETRGEWFIFSDEALSLGVVDNVI